MAIARQGATRAAAGRPERPDLCTASRPTQCGRRRPERRYARACAARTITLRNFLDGLL